jgi:hypothetical protein
MPVAPGAIDHPQPIMTLLAPARPLPAAPEHPSSNLPVTGEANSPRVQALAHAAAAEVRGPIGSVATVGPNAGHSGAPGLAGIARQSAELASNDAIQAIGVGRHVDARA